MQYFSQPNIKFRRTQRLLKMGILFLILSAVTVGGILTAWASSKRQVDVQNPTIENAMDTKQSSFQLLVPVSRIEEGTQLLAKHFTANSYSADVLPIGLIRADELSNIVGSYSKKLLVPNSPFSHSDISAYAPLSKITIPDGFRAVSIRADERTLIDGLVKPKSRVDVLWHYTNPKDESKVRTLVPFVKVLAINGVTDPSAGFVSQQQNSATLLVSRDDASRIELAQSEGRLSLTLYGGAGEINSSDTGHEAKLADLFDPSDLPENEFAGSLTTTSKSGQLIEWNLKKRTWIRNLN